MRHLNCSLRDIDESDTRSLFELLGYLQRSGRKGDRVLTIGGKRYKKVSADSAAWL